MRRLIISCLIRIYTVDIQSFNFTYKLLFNWWFVNQTTNVVWNFCAERVKKGAYMQSCRKYYTWFNFYTLPHDSGGYYVFMLDVHVSVLPSFINGFSPNLVCTLVLWRSGLGFLMGKFCQILTELPVRDTPIFSFPGDKLSKCQGILTKLGTGPRSLVDKRVDS